MTTRRGDPFSLGLWWLPWTVINGLGSILNVIAIAAGLVMHVTALWYWAIVAAWIAAAGITDIVLRRFRKLPASVRVASASRYLPSFTALGSVAALSPRLVELLGQCQLVHVLWYRQCLRHVQFATLLLATLAVSFEWVGLVVGGIIAGLLLLAVWSYHFRWKPSWAGQQAIANYRGSETDEAAHIVADSFLSDAGESACKTANALMWYARACETRTDSFPEV